MSVINPSHSEIATSLRGGAVLAYPTETVYGLGCDPWQRTAIQKLFELKGRRLEQSPLILIPGVHWLKRLTKSIDLLTARLVDQFWPGPLTIVFPASREIPAWLIRDDETIAIRMSCHPWVMEFMKTYDAPLISTSANPSGEAPASTLEDVKRYFPTGIDVVVEGTCAAASKGSTIVTVRDDMIHLLRSGDLPLETIQLKAHGKPLSL